MKVFRLTIILGLSVFYYQVNSQIPTGGLIAHYMLNANAKDASGNGHDGIIHGTSNATDRFESANNALYFDGSSDYIFVSNKPDLNPVLGITVAAWVKPRNYIGAGNDPIVDKPYYSHTSPFYQYHLAICGNYGIYPYSFGFNLSLNNQYMGVSSQPIRWSGDQWYLVVGTYDGVKMRIFVNGQPGDSLLYPGKIDSFNTDLFIARYGNTGVGTPVIIDDIKIYNRGLTYEEIVKLYDYEKPLSIDLLLSNRGNCVNQNVVFNYNGFSSFDSVAWNFGDGITSRQNLPSHVFTSSGNYQVTFTGYFRGQVFTKNSQIEIISIPVLKLKNDTVLCPGTSIIIDAGNNADSYKWNNGLTQQAITTNTSGIYSVIKTNACGSVFDTVKIEYSDFSSVYVPEDTFACANALFYINAIGSNEISYYWENNPKGANFQEVIKESKVLNLFVSDKYGCKSNFKTSITVKECAHEIEITNVFTPNGDGKNDFWVIENLDNYPKALVEVFDRWGVLVYKSGGYSNPWDGYFNGEKVSPGCYYYVIILNNGTEKLTGPLMIY